ncbi:MAG TPA: nitroreductase family deazaflavin-dependent oxidoreductase [Pseudonocardiaceae bacterium]|nr:nitroreductase family deazaflavin-dependent oxidoreductase [Pseudonocardiaceae bacterium]
MDNEKLLAMNAAMAEEFRANGGKIARFTDREILLLTTTGAKSGKPRLSPLAYVTDGSPDRLVIFASRMGAQHHPAWYHNLVANPEVTVEVGTETFTARASTATGAEHDRLYELFTSQLSGTDDHQSRTSRVIPMVVLERIVPS